MKAEHGLRVPELTRLRVDRLHRREAKHSSRLAQNPILTTTHPQRPPLAVFGLGWRPREIKRGHYHAVEAKGLLP